MTLDSQFVRAQFRAVSTPELAGLAFFEHLTGATRGRRMLRSATLLCTALRAKPGQTSRAGHRWFAKYSHLDDAASF